MADGTICRSCGTLGPGKTFTPGSFWVELFLYLLGIVPGIVYGLWRLSARRRVCQACGGTELVPVGSPVGRKLLAEQGR